MKSNNFFKVTCILIITSLIIVFSITTVFAQNQDKIKIQWMEWWSDEWGEDTVSWVVSTFEEKHPGVEVEVKFTPYQQYYQRLLTNAQAGNIPDVMGMEIVWLPQLYKLGVLENLEPKIKNSPDFLSHHNSSWSIILDGKTLMTYLYPLVFNPIYNVEQLKEKDIKLPTDWNWEDLRSVLRELKDPSKGKYGIVMPLSIEAASQFVFHVFFDLLIQAGGKMADNEGFAAFDSEAGVRTLEYLKSLLEEGLVYPGSVNGALGISAQQVYELFCSGTVPMIYSGPFIIPLAHDRNPGKLISYAPPLKNITGRGGHLVDGSGLALSSKSKYPEIAWEFYKHLTSNKVAKKMVEKLGMPWANTKVNELPSFQADPIVRAVTKITENPNNVASPNAPSEEIFAVMTTNAQEYFLNKKTAEEALSDAAKVWNEEWGKIIKGFKK